MKKILLMAAMIGGLSSRLYSQTISKIRDIKAVDANGIAINNTSKFTVKGIIMGTTLGFPGRYNVVVYDSTGSIVISQVQRPITRQPQPGDSAMVTGKLSQLVTGGNSGMTVLTDTLTITQIGRQTYPTKSATVVQKLSENWESDYVELDSLVIIDGTQWKNGSISLGYGLVQALKGKDTISLRIANVVFTQVTRAPKGYFNVSGLEFQNDVTKPYLQNYQIDAWDQSNFVFLYHAPMIEYKIGQINRVNATTGVADSIGLQCKIKGVLNSPNLSPTTGQTGTFLSVEDNTGAIIIYNTATNYGNNFHTGDSIVAYGTVAQQRGLVQFIPDSLFLLSSGNKPFSPKVVTTLEDSLEAHVVTLKNVYLTHSSQWDTTLRQNKLAMIVYVTANGVDSVPVEILRYTSLYFINKPTGNFNLTGIESQSDNTQPYFQTYYIIPRDSGDLQINRRDLPLLKIVKVKYNDVDGINVAASKNVNCYLKGVVYSGNLSAPGTLEFSIEDNTGAITVVNRNMNFSYNPSLGDSVIVRGQIEQSNGFSVIAIDTLQRISSGNKVYKANTATALSESDESYVRTIENLRLVNPAQWDTTKGGNGFYVEVIDTFYYDRFQVYISRYTDLYRQPAPQGYFNLTGVVYQMDETLPYDSGYFMVPWTKDNIRPVVPTAIQNQKQEAAFRFYPNPATSEITLISDKSGVIQIMDLSGRNLVSYPVSAGISKQLSIGMYPAGLYLIKMQSNTGVSVSKLIKN